MSYKPTLIAVILAMFCIVLLWQYGGTDLATARVHVGATPLVTADQLPIDAVNRITLTRHGEPTMVFEREGTRWMQVEPFRHPMDGYSIRQLSAVAHQVQVVQAIPREQLQEPLTEENLGLDPVHAELIYQWNDNGDDTLRLHFGRRGIGGRGYMRMGNSDEVLIVRQDLHDRVVEMNPREWRDRTIFQNVGIESDRIVRTDGNTRLVLERDRRRWRMIEPVNTRVDETSLEQFLQTLGGARSGGFIADDPSDLNRFGLAPSAAEFAITTSRQSEGAMERVTEEQVLRIGMPVGAGTQDRYGIVDGRPTVVRLPVAVLQALFIQPQALIDQTGSGVFSADVRTIRIQTPDGELTLARELERWHAPDHGRANVPTGYVEELLGQLTQLQANDVLVQPYPHELERAVVTFFGSRNQPLDTVRIVHDPNTDAWALENGDNVLRVFSSGFQPRLTPDQFGLQSVLND